MPLIQAEIKAPKSQYNKFGQYNYRNLEDICEAAKKVCRKYVAHVNITDDIVLVGDRYFLKSTASIFFADGSCVSADGYAEIDASKKGMDLAQLTGACASYSGKYAMGHLLALDDTRDFDSNEHSKEQQQQEPPKAPTQKSAKVAPPPKTVAPKPQATTTFSL